MKAPRTSRSARDSDVSPAWHADREAEAGSADLMSADAGGLSCWGALADYGIIVRAPSMRDDFSEHVKRVLAQRVGNHCSRPKCGAPTVGPQIHDEGVVNVGVAAHITAASPGGPRYDPTLTSIERRRLSNAVWLCQTCAALVDRDPHFYTADVLRTWRGEAEAMARTKLVGPAVTDVGAASRDYDRLIRDSVEAFAVVVERLNVFAPEQLFRLVDGEVAAFLGRAGAMVEVLAIRHNALLSASWNADDQSSFSYISFVLMARGFLLDRFVLLKDLAPRPLPPLPEWETIDRRWYEDFLVQNKWLYEWSTPFARDLVDAQWPKLEAELKAAFSGSVVRPEVLAILKASLLQGMLAHQFLYTGAPEGNVNDD